MQSSIVKFAKQHGLKLKVVKQSMLYYARFDDTCIKERGFLGNIHGSGATPKQAIDDYAHNVELKTLVVNACDENHYEIEVPRLF